MSRTNIHGGVLNEQQRLAQMNKQTNKQTQCIILYNKGHAPEMDAPDVFVGEGVSCD